MADDVIKEFRRLFWKARRQHMKLRRAGGARECPEHQEALTYARTYNLERGESLLEASVLEEEGKLEEALGLLDTLSERTPETARHLVWFLRGNAFAKQKRWDDTISAYRKALDEPNCDNPGVIWNNLGNALSEKGEYDKAINAYRKALDEPDINAPGDTWYNLGRALYAKGLLDEAISAYQNALDDRDYDTPAEARNNIGVALFAKGDFDGAINAYRKALDEPNHDSPGKAWNNLGVALSSKRDYGESINAFRKALKDPEAIEAGFPFIGLAIAYWHSGHKQEALDALQKITEHPDKYPLYAARAKSLLAVIESELDEESLSSDDRALLEGMPSAHTTEGAAATIEQRLLDKMEADQQTLYETYTNKNDSERDNQISILRGWSSAVPLLEGSERACRGGGYFVKWQGKGIVIDPGFDFLCNFHDEKFHGREIDTVIVSHGHSDHNADLKSIDDLRYELYKESARGKHGKARPYVLICDPDTKRILKYSQQKPKHRLTPAQFDAGRCEISDRDTDTIQLDLPFSLEYFCVTHDKDTLEGAFGFKLHLNGTDGNPFTIGYTGDTQFFAKLPKHLANCDLLIAHISQPSVEELKEPNKYKADHLGFRGMVDLITACKPKATIVSEFWAGMGDMRIDLVKAIRKKTGSNAILPGSIGMHIHLPSMEVECTQCHKRVPFENVQVSPPANKFGNLSYLCSDCVLR